MILKLNQYLNYCIQMRTFRSNESYLLASFSQKERGNRERMRERQAIKIGQNSRFHLNKPISFEQDAPVLILLQWLHSASAATEIGINTREWLKEGVLKYLEISPGLMHQGFLITLLNQFNSGNHAPKTLASLCLLRT